MLVEIQGEQYEFCNRIGESKELLHSFNELASKTFAISFEQVGGEYEPHTLIQNGQVCANISVNQIPFIFDDRRIRGIQLGTVMTRKEYRHKGLSRYLMEWILNEWKDKSDIIYLFANDSVLQFYPKFGFVQQDEYEYTLEDVVASKAVVIPMNMTKQTEIDLLWRKYKEGNPFSKFQMVENKVLIDFYCLGFLKEHLYYVREADAIVVAKEEGDMLIVDEVFGGSKATMEFILTAVAKEHTKKIRLGFTPKESLNLTCGLHREEDTTLFVYKGFENLIQNEKVMFPVLSHA